MAEALLQYGLFVAFPAFGIGALLSLVLGSQANERAASIVAHTLAALGSLAALAFGIAVLMTGADFSASLGTIGFLDTAVTLHVGSLGALFISTIALIACFASVYGIRYQEHFIGRYRLGPFGFFYNVFIASMIAVVATDNSIVFLLAWEIMAAASYFLVIFERHERGNVSAGLLYIIISQLGAAFLLAAILLMHSTSGSWNFESLGTIGVGTLAGNLILGFALIGLSSKAGVIPLHIWLPEAHPAAPSHVSALMSGVMIKTAIFMMVRFFVEFSTPDATWGLLILGLGAISGLLGILYALSESDIKRLLAFSSVENIGIMLLGLGASVVFFSYELPAAGILALGASLYHTVNHALFKSLLFLSAGSVVHATGTRNMEAYGGLIKKMPSTAIFFLIGAVAISGLPPFNGFVSEWLTFQSLFLGVAALPLEAKVVFLLGAASLAFTGGLAAACFVKAFGTTFLARSRAEARPEVHEAGILMTLPMAGIAGLTLVFGVGATSMTSVVTGIAANLKGISSSAPSVASPFRALAVADFSVLAMVSVFLAIALAVFGAYAALRFISRNRTVRISHTWNCGAPLTPRMEITATAFSRSLITIFRRLLYPSIQKDAEYHDASMRYFAKSRMVHLSVPNLYRTYLYEPTALLIEKGGLRVRRIQTGNLHAYLLYIFVTVAALLWWALK